MKPLLTMAALLCAFLLSARTNTLRSTATPPEQLALLERITAADTLRMEHQIVISGYRKTVSDAKESFFVTNDTPFHLSRLQIRFTYFYGDTSEMLHEETYDIECDIPAGETRQLLVSTFDRQHKMYYLHGKQPKNPATPYTVKYRLMSFDTRINIAQ